MARGYDLDKERRNKVSLLGKDLARRSKSKCELCEASGVKLNIFEVKPIAEEPNIEKSVLLCESCIDTIERLSKAKQNDLRFLNASVWSEIPIVKAFSVAILKEVSKKEDWPLDILENVYLDEESEKLLDEIEI